jgi:large subunit ribosomal protein L16
MLSPKKTKFRKMHRGRLKGYASKNNKLFYGSYGIQILKPAWLSSQLLETIRKLISRYTKRTGKLWFKIFPDKPITARAKESRMGSGKGSVIYWVAIVKPNTILLELDNISKVLAYKALTAITYKLPVKSKIITK